MTLHNGHEFVEEEEFLSKKKKIWEGNKNALKKLDDLYTTEAKLRKIKESEDTMYNKAKENIQNRATTDWEYWSKKLLELEVKKLSVNQGIDRELRNLDREKEKFQEVINIVDVIKSSKDVYQFFERFDEVITSLNFELVPFKSNFGSISDFVEESKYSQQKRNNSIGKISFKVVNQYTTDIMSIHFLTELSDQTLLMSDSQSKVVQHVKLEVNIVQVISNFNIQIQGMTISPFGDILLSTYDEKLKVLDMKTGEITNSVYNVHPLKTIMMYLTKDNRVIIGAKSPGPAFPATGRRVVMVMDQEGNHLKEYEYDNNNKPLFTYPRSVTSSNGKIFVIDSVDADRRGRVVVLGERGYVIQIYCGHPHINTERKPFKPARQLTMPSGHIIITDLYVDTLHILNSFGQFISYHNFLDMGIKLPYSLALSSSGHLYIGCTFEKEGYKSKLYKLQYNGF